MLEMLTIISRHIITGLIIGLLSTGVSYLVLLLDWKNDLLTSASTLFMILACSYILKDTFVLSLIFPDIGPSPWQVIIVLLSTYFFFTIATFGLFMGTKVEWYYYCVDIAFYVIVLVVLYVLITIFRKATKYDEIMTLYTIPIGASVLYHAIYAFLAVPFFVSNSDTYTAIGQNRDNITRFLILSITHPILTELKMFIFRYYADHYKNPYKYRSKCIFPMDFSLNSLFTFLLLTRIDPWWLNMICSTMLVSSTAILRYLRRRLNHSKPRGRDTFQFMIDISSIVASPIFMLQIHNNSRFLLHMENSVLVTFLLSGYQLTLTIGVRILEEKFGSAATDMSDTISDLETSKAEICLCMYTHCISLLYMMFNFRSWPMIIMCSIFNQRCL